MLLGLWNLIPTPDHVQLHFSGLFQTGNQNSCPVAESPFSNNSIAIAVRCYWRCHNDPATSIYVRLFPFQVSFPVQNKFSDFLIPKLNCLKNIPFTNKGPYIHPIAYLYLNLKTILSISCREEHLTLGNSTVLIQQFSVSDVNKFTANGISFLTILMLDSCQSTLTK